MCGRGQLIQNRVLKIPMPSPHIKLSFWLSNCHFDLFDEPWLLLRTSALCTHGGQRAFHTEPGPENSNAAVSHQTVILARQTVIFTFFTNPGFSSVQAPCVLMGPGGRAAGRDCGVAWRSGALRCSSFFFLEILTVLTGGPFLCIWCDDCANSASQIFLTGTDRQQK